MTDTERFIECDAQNLADMVDQIGRNIFAISGGRVIHRATGVTLPVAHGYSVLVDLAAGDTYTVRRQFKRGMKTWIKGERTNVYVDDLGEVAYYASCWVSYDENEWPHKA